ncbi:MAG: translocation/assembly module TamB domain-containing protein [Brevinema sp.]
MTEKDKKPHFSIHISQKTLRILFRMALVYILFLGAVNVGLFLAKPTIISTIKSVIGAREVRISGISNVPFIFISISQVDIVIDDEIKFELRDVYFRYRLWHIFTRKWELVPASFTINKTSVEFHTYALKMFRQRLAEQYPATPKEPPQESPETTKNSAVAFDPSKMIFDVRVRNTAATVRAMGHYRVDATINSAYASIKNNTATWRTDLNIITRWSNQVDILTLNAKSEGAITNFNLVDGIFDVVISRLNLGGLPVVSQRNEEIMALNFSLNQGAISFNSLSQLEGSPDNMALQGDARDFTLKIDRPFSIRYGEYEAYQALDYAFKPGRYRLTVDLKNNPDWNARLSITSPDHPDYGASLAFFPREDGTYAFPVDIRTHFFGNLKGNLGFDFKNRAGLMPLPYGILDLENVRFLLPGLVFSGHAIAKNIANRNALDITVYDVAMNGGRIGNTRVDLGIEPGGKLIIKPLPFSNDVQVFVDVGGKVDVLLRATKLDGDFLAKNTYLTVFGLHTSVYEGDVRITKAGRFNEVLVSGNVEGFQDGEKQIEIEMQFTNEMIKVPRLYFMAQKILIQGDVTIEGGRTNTLVGITANARIGAPPEQKELTDDPMTIPIVANVLIGGDKTEVNGLVDNLVPVTAIALGTDVDLIFNFKQYPLEKLSIGGMLSGDLAFKFAPGGWNGFAFSKGTWEVADRIVTLDFAASGTESYLPLEYFRAGLDNQLLSGQGYIDVRDGIGGAVRFDQGGSLQFITGEYTWKVALDLRDYRIDELFSLPIFGPLSTLQDASTEIIYANMRVNLNGQLANPDVEGSFNLVGDAADKVEAGVTRTSRFRSSDRIDNPAFQLVTQRFAKVGGDIILQNLRLRHPSYNIDGNIRFSQSNPNDFSADLTGALAILGNAVKTGLRISIKKNEETSVVTYQIPNLYVLSRASMQMSGKIIQEGTRLLFISDNPKYGISGYYDFNTNGGLWNVMFQSDALRLVSEGRNTPTTMFGYIDGQAFLKKLNLSKPISKVDGTAEIHLKAEGPIDNPTVNGSIVFEDVLLRTTALRNQIRLPDRNTILIQRNRIVIPETTIIAGSRDIFGLEGWVNIQDRAIQDLRLNLYSKNGTGTNSSSLNWRLNVPYLSVNGQTAIEYFTVSGSVGDIGVKSAIHARNMNVNFELQDLLAGTGEQTPNEFLNAILASLNFDIDFNLANSARFLNQLFDFRFQPSQALQVRGSLADNSFAIKGSMPIQGGTINYLGRDLKIETGSLFFSGDSGDPFPSVNVAATSTARESQGDQVTVNVDFRGKLPDIELASLSSSPPRSRAEIYGLLGFGAVEGGGRDNTNLLSSSQEAVASSVGIAENALFIAPLTQRLRRAFGFFDTIQLKTDVLGNLVRASSLGTSLSGLALLNGSEVELGVNVPTIPSLQLRGSVRFEAPQNNVLDTYLQQQYKLGLIYDYRTPSLWQMSLGVNGRILVDPPVTSAQSGAANPTTEYQYEFLVEAGFRRSFGYKPPERRPAPVGPQPKEPIFE